VLVMSLHGHHEYSLLDLPPEVLAVVLKHCTLASLGRLAQSCRSLRHFVYEDAVWRRFASKEDFVPLFSFRSDSFKARSENSEYILTGRFLPLLSVGFSSLSEILLLVKRTLQPDIKFDNFICHPKSDILDCIFWLNCPLSTVMIGIFYSERGSQDLPNCTKLAS
jgi:hypothetical protein